MQKYIIINGENLDIFEIANQNSTNLQTLYKSMEKRFRVEKKFNMIDYFIKSMKNSLGVSINMRDCTLNDFLIGGKYHNVYTLKEERKKELDEIKKTEVSVEQAVKKHLKDYSKSRVTFDSNFKDGKNFKYGAINIGGLGINKYGEFCTIINLKQLEKYKSLAFIKEDSLKYIDNNHVNIEHLRNSIANKECVHILALLKHENDIKKIPQDKWASMICCNESYIEAITNDEILNTHITTIRMSKKNYKKYYDYLYKDFLNETGDMEKYQLSILLGNFKLIEKQGIKLEIIDEN